MQHLSLKLKKIKLLDKSEISWFSYFYIFCMFIYAGSATAFARDLGDLRTIGNGFAIFITMVFWVLNKIRLSRPYYVSIAVFLLYAAITSINNKTVNPRWISEWIIWLTIAYGICQGLKGRMFVVVETVLYHLCIIALACWVVQIINEDLMTRIVKALEFSQPYEEECNVEANMILYTINSVDVYADDEFFLFLRNAGFAWEPGAFACFVCLGLFCNLIRTNFKLVNRSLWVFLLALLSTQSTTGFLIFLVMVVLWLVLNKKYVILLILLPIGITIFELPFVKEKLFEEIENLKYDDARNISGAVGRIYSLQLNYEEFLRHPIIGLGGNTEGTWLAQHNYDVATISGIGHMLVYFGAVMTLLFLILLVRSCNYIKEVMRSQNAFILLVTILGMMVSYGLWKQPIYIAFWMFCVYGSDYMVNNAENKRKRHKIRTKLFE